jgi:hypothetical protein
MRDEAVSEQQTKELDKWQAWDEFLELNTDMGFRQSSWYVAFTGSSPDYARWLPILRNQLKNMGLSRIRHVLAFAVTNSLTH